MDKITYGLCAATAFWCATLLLRSYAKNRVRLLLWSGMCFVGLTLNNLLLIADRLMFTAIDMSIWRLLASLVAVLLLLVGLVLESHP